jgi:hypothetical protein
MTRNLKALGLALVAALAISVAFASAAQATTDPLEVTCEEYPCTLTGENIEHEGSIDFQYSVGATTFRCSHVTATATIESEAENDEVTAEPTYTGCTASPGNLPVTVTMNGCAYILHGGNVTPGEDHHFDEGTITIECPDNLNIETHVYQNAHNHSTGVSLCTYHIGEQTIGGSDEITYTNTTGSPDDVDLTFNEAETDITKTSGGILCPTGGGHVLYRGGLTLRAYEDPGPHNSSTQTTLTISDPTP